MTTNFAFLAEPYVSPSAFEAVRVLCPPDPSSSGDCPFAIDLAVCTTSTLSFGNSYQLLSMRSAVLEQRHNVYIGSFRIDTLEVYLSCLETFGIYQILTSST